MLKFYNRFLKFEGLDMQKVVLRREFFMACLNLDCLKQFKVRDGSSLIYCSTQHPADG